MAWRHRGDDVIAADECVETPPEGSSGADEMAAYGRRHRHDDRDDDDDDDAYLRSNYELDMQLFERVSTIQSLFTHVFSPFDFLPW